MIDLLLAVLIWGLSFALAKQALNEFSPFQLVTVRLALGSLTAFVLNYFTTPKIIQAHRSWAPVILGGFEFAGTYLLYTWSLSYLPSGMVGTLTLTTPIFTMFIGRLFKVNILNWYSFAAAGISFCGALLCFPFAKIFGNFSLSSQTILGLCLLMASNLLFAVGNVLISKWEGQKRWDQSLTSRGLGYGAVMALIITVISKQTSLTHLGELKVWYLPLYLGIVATGLGFFLWNRGVQKVSAFPSSLIGNFKAPLSVLWGIILLHESFDFKFVLGLILLFCAAIMIRLPNRIMVQKAP